MRHSFFVLVFCAATECLASDAGEGELVGQIGTRLNDAIARYSENQDSFHEITDRFSDQPNLVGLGLAFYDSQKVETCSDEGGEDSYNEVCAVIRDGDARREFLNMEVDRIRRDGTSISFEAMESSDADTDFLVTYEYTSEPEREISPCEQLKKPRGMDSCTYDLGDGWRINIMWSDLVLDPSAQ